ncbi:unnamed protein product (mitochondrion) [Plasmodiophora brassicae]|uniref:FZ domain-containing protein n=1 Tax=Plasmodiophora brassicae TaxID=37360 RepID=A0A0G4J583_PLABS|nr:hypothetical protein PBRA_002672 [Plasmodiophora brassicae]SPQ94830.1 unnamed protein product [Plasmodiophora brassicae]
MLTATVLALAPMMILAQTNYADYPLTQDALNKYCGGLTTPAQKCAAGQFPEVDTFCRFSTTVNKCAFIGTSCPPNMGSAVKDLGNCGATSKDTCPATCQTAMDQVSTQVMCNAGLTSYQNLTALANSQEQASDNLLVSSANLYLCLTQLPLNQFSSAMTVTCNASADAVTAAMSKCVAGGSSGHSSGAAGINAFLSVLAAAVLSFAAFVA